MNMFLGLLFFVCICRDSKSSKPLFTSKWNVQPKDEWKQPIDYENRKTWPDKLWIQHPKHDLKHVAGDKFSKPQIYSNWNVQFKDEWKQPIDYESKKTWPVAPLVQHPKHDSLKHIEGLSINPWAKYKESDLVSLTMPQLQPGDKSLEKFELPPIGLSINPWTKYKESDLVSLSKPKSQPGDKSLEKLELPPTELSINPWAKYKESDLDSLSKPNSQPGDKSLAKLELPAIGLSINPCAKYKESDLDSLSKPKSQPGGKSLEKLELSPIGLSINPWAKYKESGLISLLKPESQPEEKSLVKLEVPPIAALNAFQNLWEQYKGINFHSISKPKSKPEDTLSPKYEPPLPIDPLPSRKELYTDPATWPGFYKQCSGKQQSPINISTEMIRINYKFGSLQFTNYNKPLPNLTIKNVGFTVYLSIPSEANCLVTSNWLIDKFRLYRVEFRWSSASNFGSDHTVDGHYYPLEVRLLHLNTKYNVSSAESDAYLTLIVFHKLKKDNSALRHIIEMFPEIIFPDRNTTLKQPFTLLSLLPKRTDSYITYHGSRIYIPCSENYRYIIFNYAKPISKTQLREFQRLRRILPGEKSSKTIEIGTRPVQPLLNRVIHGSISSSEKKTVSKSCAG